MNPPLIHFPSSNIIHPNYHPLQYCSSNYSSFHLSNINNYSLYPSYHQHIFNNYILQNSQFYITNYNQQTITNHIHSSPQLNEEKKPKIEEKTEKSLTPNKKLSKKRKRITKKCTACPHTFAVHYAKNMCSNCYHIKGRNKKPWKCIHTNKSHYALGLCQNCYQMNYNKKQCQNENISSKDELATNTGTSHTFT